MTGEDTAKKLDELIELALKEDPAIRETFQTAGFEGRELHDELAQERDAIWEVTLEEAKKRDINRQELERREKRLVADIGEPPAEGEAPKSSLDDVFDALGGLYLFGLMVFGAVAFYRGWRPNVASLATIQGWMYVALWFVPLVVWGAAQGWRSSRQARSETARRAAYTSRKEEWQKKRDGAAMQSGIVSLTETIEAQDKEIEKLLNQRVRSAIISAINRRLAPSYATTLSIRKPRGFGEVFDKKLTIITPARRRLEFMLRSMPGGSVGIAGSRGAGKTTLLKLFCGPKRVIEKLNDKPVLGVLVSAPVAYQARDFILYLFSAICQNVIEAEGGKFRLTGAPKDAPADDPLQSRTADVLRRLPPLFIRAGLVICAVSLVVAFVLAAAQAAQSLPRASAPQSPTPTTAQPVQSPLPANTTGAPVPQAQPTTPQPAPSSERAPAAALSSKFLELLKLEPASWLASGILLIVFGLLLAEALQMDVWRSFLIVIGRMLVSALGRVPVYGKLVNRFLERQYQMADREEVERRQMKMEMPTPPDQRRPSDLRIEAEEFLKAIKFQQSYTSGWSGSLKLPIGVEGGVNRAVTLAQNQLSLPEVVQFLTSFIDRISLQYQVIIGIDEMDKLATDALAQRFLNDIKSIFGLERCFYLISVSENAMSNFERRGIAFRDVFDSSFDDFVYVDYLKFTSAQELLEQRVVGRAIPFFGLSYCMSGGLPRDLIRNFRSVLEVYGGTPPVDRLSEICKAIVNNDLRAKIRATQTSAKKIHLEPEVDQFLEILHDVEPRLDHFGLLIESGARILDMGKRLSSFNGAAAAAHAVPQKKTNGSNKRSTTDQKSDGSTDKDRARMLAQLADLADELGTYVYYAVTLRQFFTDTMVSSAFTTPPMDGDLDSLAKARQLLAMNPGITRTLLKSFRVAHGLTGLPN